MSEKFDPLVAEWISFVKNPNFNLIEKCLKFSQLIEYPDLHVEEYIKKINCQYKYFIRVFILIDLVWYWIIRYK